MFHRLDFLLELGSLELCLIEFLFIDSLVMLLSRDLLVERPDVFQDFLHGSKVHTLHATFTKQLLTLDLKLILDCALLLTEFLICLNLALLDLLSLKVSRPLMVLK